MDNSRGQQDLHWSVPIGSCAAMCKLLSVPNRLELMLAVMHEPASVGELAESLGLDCSLLSHHLGLLRRAGLVASKQVGHKHEYRLGPAVVHHERDASRVRMTVRGGDGVTVDLTLAVPVSLNGVLREPKPERPADRPPATRPRGA
ncbi:MAG: metalloregulator ArsR/SmtB family transcription factor [Phycisphaerales bacterium JB041]